MFDKHADEAIEAEIWLKAEAKGRDNRNVEMALDMLADNKPIKEIVKYSRLPEDKVLELKQSLAKNALK
jgi:predicted methyltransferase